MNVDEVNLVCVRVYFSLLSVSSLPFLLFDFWLSLPFPRKTKEENVFRWNGMRNEVCVVYVFGVGLGMKVDIVKQQDGGNYLVWRAVPIFSVTKTDGLFNV